MRALRSGVSAVLWLFLLPAVAFAQASITGVVKDSSGAVLPGVTVEAASPALLEKIRTATTDGNGQYRITELRPGAYVVTFTLPGFTGVKRDGINLTGSFTSTVDATLSVGNLNETVTVTGEAPIVDVQSATRQRVMDTEAISTLPTGRNMFELGVLIPGISISTGGLASQNVGGALGPETRALVAHGGRTEDQRFMMNGVSLSSMIGGGWGGGAIPNATGVQEMVFDTASVSADLATGGVRINFIAREGGNQYHGSFFGNFANGAMQTTNIDADLLARNPLLRNAGTVDRNWDFNPGFGGPIRRDRIWFFASGRHQGAYLFAPGIFYNQNENDPTKWNYEPDLSRPASLEKTWLDAQLRTTFQINQKNKLGVTYQNQVFCACHDAINATTAPEAAVDRRFPVQRVILLDWTAPMTSKVLIEASAIHRVERWGNMHLQEKGLNLDPAMIGVLDQAAPTSSGTIADLNYRGRVGTYNNSWNENIHYRFNVSYITGSHAFKFGMNNAHGYHDNLTYAQNPMSFRFNNGVPNQLTIRAIPNTQKISVDQDLGLFAQDKWTMNRLTVSYGIRYDHFRNSFPEQQLGPTQFTPNRNLTFAETKNTNFKDITPKSQIAYDVFGTGKTALKVSLNKYLQGLGTGPGGLTGGPNPIALLSTQVSRSWTDGNGNFAPDCDLLNPALQDNRASGGDLCGAFAAGGFGLPIATSKYDPEVLTGWGNRFYNWEFSTGVQHELLPRLGLDVSYFRRWYGNFNVTDNRAVAASEYDYFSVTAPADSRLPNGGGHTVTGFANLNPSAVGRLADNIITPSGNYGDQVDRWNGVDVNVNARLSNGLFVQGGTSTGRRVTDNCEILAAVPEAGLTSAPYCHEAQKWLTQVKGAASYVIPRIDVSAAATYQYLPGPEIAANWAVPNRLVAPSLGRNLSGNAQTVTVNLLEPARSYGDGLNQLDLRFAKILRFGGTRTTVNVDLYNATNANTILTQNNGYVVNAAGQPTTWQVPTAILQPRFWKIGAQIDF